MEYLGWVGYDIHAKTNKLLSAQLEDLRRQDADERDTYKLQIEDLKDKCQEKQMRVEEEQTKFMEFQKQVALNSLNSRSGKIIPPKVGDNSLLQITYKSCLGL